MCTLSSYYTPRQSCIILDISFHQHVLEHHRLHVIIAYPTSTLEDFLLHRTFDYADYIQIF